MREQIQTVRNNLIIQAWAENKNMMTMAELAEMFGITLQHAYRILKENNIAKAEIIINIKKPQCNSQSNPKPINPKNPK